MSTQSSSSRRAPIRQTSPMREWSSFKFNGFTMEGYSRAADRTFLYIAELKLGLDAGGVCGRQARWTFLTHGHDDHSKDIVWVSAREGSQIYCPTQIVPFIENHIKHSVQLNDCKPFDTSNVPFTLHGLLPGDEFEFNYRWSVRAIECFHKVPSIGFAVREKRSKLKPEYSALTGAEIAVLRKAGTVVSQDMLIPTFVFLGDTGIEVFKDEYLWEFPYVICECTFLWGEEELARTFVDGHIHWSQLWPIVVQQPQTHFVLTHFSHRYSVEEIVTFLDAECDRLHLSNVTIFAGNYVGA